MDYKQKKQLTQSVGYMQSTLNIGPELIDSLKAKELFTNEEIMTIQVLLIYHVENAISPAIYYP